MDVLLLIVIAGIAGQLGFIWWSRRRAERGYLEARRKQAELIEQATRDDVGS